MFVHAYTPKPPCTGCGHHTLIGESGRWYCALVENERGEAVAKAFWMHLWCAVIGGLVQRVRRTDDLAVPQLEVPGQRPTGPGLHVPA